MDALQTTKDGATNQSQFSAAHHLPDRLPVPSDLLVQTGTLRCGAGNNHYTVWYSSLLSDNSQSGQMAGGHLAGHQSVVLQVLHLYAQPGEVRLGTQDSTI